MDMPVKALIILGHGSRRRESNDEIAHLAMQLAPHIEAGYPIVTHAFAELARPTLPEAVADVVKQGATGILIIPYFLAEGRHVVEDTPRLVAQAQQENPGIEIKVSSHVGKDNYMTILLERIVSQEGDR